MDDISVSTECPISVLLNPCKNAQTGTREMALSEKSTEFGSPESTEMPSGHGGPLVCGGRSRIVWLIRLSEMVSSGCK